MLCKYLALFFPLLICLLQGATSQLIPEEVESLKQIAKVLGKTDWDFSVDPCSGLRKWSTSPQIRGSENAVTCDCSFLNNTLCRVVSIVLKGQNLPGTLPKEFLNLPFLKEIDLTRNYLNGTIPAEWGSTQLVNISLIGNRLSGSLPKELGNISTLANLTLEFNQLSGPLPPELGNLPRLERILLTSNNFTGELPVTLAKLRTLTDFRISDNRFVGSIPNFIQNWTNIQKLVIQASGLNGPIPPGISLLTKLNDLRISDLNGNDSIFPDLSRARSMKTLILRSCGIVGVLPDYLTSMTNVKLLDLSFNKLSGEIPRNSSALSNNDYIYLTGNLLTGQVPSWMLSGGDEIATIVQVLINSIHLVEYRLSQNLKLLGKDLSYNNFTAGTTTSSCQGSKPNLFSSSSKGNTSGIVSCLRSFRCPKDRYYSLHINCGGAAITSDNNTRYEDDDDSGGPAKFHQSRTNWAFSSTGHFLDDDRPNDAYIWQNSSQIFSNNPRLYTTARLSPLSLTYYGFCLGNGNYTVNLHFAEIMFTNDTTYSSLGRRIFDIYIQGKLVRKDFNIEDEAGGVNKPVVIPFTAAVIDSTLEIRFYWAGKGTIGIPVRGVYGPLISAISVEPNFTVPSVRSKTLSVGAIVGIVIGVIFSISLLLVVLWWKGCLCNKYEIAHDLKGLNLQTGTFTLKEIKAATNNFDKANKIGEGGFGPVYKGDMPDGTVIAVKQLSAKSKQGNREFVNEIGMSALQHPNLVKLYGCCIEGNQLLLVYEYLENNSLARALFGPEQQQLNLDWKTRHKICVGIARGLAYLHEESRLKIVHRDIKATNVLLDKNLNPKISDFGLAKLDEEDNTHISTRIAGTFGYMAPEYAMRGRLTDKADVYSFGVVLLEVVSGKSNTSVRPKQDSFYLLDWANLLKEEGRLMELIDDRLGSNFNKKEAMATINIALLCTDVLSDVRPNMSSVVSMLERGSVDKMLVSESSVISEMTSADEENPKDKLMDSMSMDVSWTTNSGSTDLYPVSVEETQSGR